MLGFQQKIPALSPPRVFPHSPAACTELPGASRHGKPPLLLQKHHSPSRFSETKGPPSRESSKPFFPRTFWTANSPTPPKVGGCQVRPEIPTCNTAAPQLPSPCSGEQPGNGIASLFQLCFSLWAVNSRAENTTHTLRWLCVWGPLCPATGSQSRAHSPPHACFNRATTRARAQPARGTTHLPLPALPLLLCPSQTLCAPQEPFYGLRTTPGVLPRRLELLHCCKLTLSVLLWGTCPLTALLLRASLTSQRAALPLLSLLPWLEKPSTAGTDGVRSWGGGKWHFLPNSWAGVWCQSYL